MVKLPLSAIVGQDEAILALQLAAIDPAVGGVLLRGPRGTAKSSMARGLAAWLDGAPFVELPLGADEDKLVGSLDLQAVLGEREVRAQRGLLARADGGVLYADEVNLLPDHLVDLLLDTAASGVVRVEREGVSQEHAAACVLVGTMNPDEGELRPQLLDRFGLCVDVTTPVDPAERSAVLRQRLLLRDDQAAFAGQHASAESEARDRLRAARERVSSVRCDAVLDRIAAECADNGVDGLRGDLAWLAAARAHAALSGHDEITESDLADTRDMALRHRLPESPPEPPQPPSRRPQESRSTTENKAASGGSERESTAQDSPRADAATTRGEGSVGASPATPAQRGRHRVSSGGRSIAWARTLTHSPELPSERNALHWRSRWRKQGGPWILLLDCSASMLRNGVLARTQGAVLALLRDAYRQRREVAVLRFAGDRVDTLHPMGRPPKEALDFVRVVRGGGGTPLRDGLSAARDLVRRAPCRATDVTLWVFTDGRTSLDDLPDPGCAVTVVDTDPHAGRGGTRHAERLAHVLNAHHTLLGTTRQRAA